MSELDGKWLFKFPAHPLNKYPNMSHYFMNGKSICGAIPYVTVEYTTTIGTTPSGPKCGHCLRALRKQ